MEETSKSKILIAGNKDNCIKGAKALYEYFLKESKEHWSPEISEIEKEESSVVSEKQYLAKLKTNLPIQNKYFKANIEVHLLLNSNDAIEPLLSEYEGLITIVDPPGLSNLKSWLISGTCDELQLRITVINTSGNFDLESHFESLELYTETVAEDLDTLYNLRQTSEDGAEDQGFKRVVEAIQETAWHHHSPLPAKQGYKSVVDDDGADRKADSDKAGTAGDKKLGLHDEFSEENMENDMKLLEEIMAMKAVSSGLSHEERKRMAEKMMSKLEKVWGSDFDI